MIFCHRRRGGKRLPKKPAVQSGQGARLAALLLFLSLLAGLLPMPAQAEEETKNKLADIVTFDSITLHYAGADGQPEAEAVQDGTLIEKNRQLALRYTYTISEDKCSQIIAGTNYYLEVSPHLALPHLESGSPLILDGEERPFGYIHADGNRAWVEFLAGTDGALLLGSEGIEDAYFYLDCSRAADVPGGENPIEGHSNLYAMKFENNTQFNFGYAENEPVNAQAQISKDGSLADKTITWTIDYTPWQNPAPDDPVTPDTPFELRDTIDTGLHSYVNNSVTITIDNTPVTVTYYTSGDTINRDVDAYVIVDTPTDDNTTLTFGGTKFNAGQATQGNPAAPLKITYQTAINDELLLPGGTGGKQVKNKAELFAGKDGVFNSLNISSREAVVTVQQPTWLTKEGHTTRTPGNGSTTDWEVVFYPNGFTFADANGLTLHDRLPQGSTPVAGSLYVNGTQTHVEVGADNSFTVSPIVPNGNDAVKITYQTHVPEGMYDSGTSLGSNIAWFTFQYGDRDYETPQAKRDIGSGDGSGTPGTATLVKTNIGYNAAARTIEWTLTINPHKASLQSGAFTDNLGAVIPACAVSGHGHGLELVGGVDGIAIKINGNAPTDDERALIDLAYTQQVLTVTVKRDGGKVIGAKTVTLTYTTRVCDPCIFAGNTPITEFTNTISGEMLIGSTATELRPVSADSPVKVGATVLTKKPPVYDYATGLMRWTVEVDAAGLPMAEVVLTDELPTGLTYVENSFVTNPVIVGALASAQGQTLTVNLGTVTGKTTVTFDTRVDPEFLGFGGDQPVVLENTVRMDGSADGVTFATVSHSVQQSFSNHGLVKSSAVDNAQELIQYEVLINPYRLALSENPSLVDTLDARLQLDADTLKFYRVTLEGTSGEGGDRRPAYKDKEEIAQPPKLTGFDPVTNSYTVQLPIPAGSTNAYLLTYSADMMNHQAGGYSNSVRFEGSSVLLGGEKTNTAAVGGGGGGGGGGVAARKATITIVKTDSETSAPIPGVTFLLYQWDSDSGTRGLPFAQGTTDARGKLSFRVKPGAIYELVETGSAPGYGSAFGWSTLPGGVEEKEGALLITAGAAKSELTLNLTNEAYTTDIVFRLVNGSGIPMAGSSVKIFTSDPTGQANPTPAREATVSSDGTVRFSAMRRGARYFIQRPGGEIMTVDVPPQESELPKVILPDGTSETLTEDYRAEGSTTPEQEWTLTVNKVISGGETPLAGAAIGLYADAACQTWIKTGISGPDGIVAFSGLIKGQHYWVRETAAPGGYQLNANPYEGTEGTPITIENTPSPVIPIYSNNSGGPDEPDTPDESGAPGEPETPEDPDGGGTSAGDTNIPQTGDPTQLLIVVTLFSGVLLAAMMLYQLWGTKAREEK